MYPMPSASAAHTRAAQGPRVPLGAVAAITLDFPLDVALKRNMAAPTTSPVPRVGATLLAFRLLRDRGFRVVFAGLGVKSCEFGVSYACTGYVSTLFR